MTWRNRIAMSCQSPTATGPGSGPKAQAASRTLTAQLRADGGDSDPTQPARSGTWSSAALAAENQCAGRCGRSNIGVCWCHAKSSCDGSLSCLKTPPPTGAVGGGAFWGAASAPQRRKVLPAATVAWGVTGRLGPARHLLGGGPPRSPATPASGLGPRTLHVFAAPSALVRRAFKS